MRSRRLARRRRLLEAEATPSRNDAKLDFVNPRPEAPDNSPYRNDCEGHSWCRFCFACTGVLDGATRCCRRKSQGITESTMWDASPGEQYTRCVAGEKSPAFAV